MTHVLLCPTPQSAPRWKRALPDGEHLKQMNEQAVQADALWVHTDVANWQSLVAERSAAGQAVIVLTGVPNAQDLRLALSAGARGYEHSWSSEPVLAQIAMVVENGGIWVGPELMSALIKLSTKTAANPAITADKSTVDWSLLSVRETDVAKAVVTGASNKEIARQLDITERTVKAHLSAIFQKLEVRDRLHLALLLRE